jgi:hypothetical protein
MELVTWWHKGEKKESYSEMLDSGQKGGSNG